jgi:hypothetical protein
VGRGGIKLIAAATGAAADTVGKGAAELETGIVVDTNTYQRGIKITDKEMKAFEATHLQRHTFHGDWNYTVTASPGQDTTRPNRENLTTSA